MEKLYSFHGKYFEKQIVFSSIEKKETKHLQLLKVDNL